MADKIETAQGKCPEHGVVEGVRCLPGLTVPLAPRTRSLADGGGV